MAQENSQKRIADIRFQQPGRISAPPTSISPSHASSRGDRFGALVVEPMQRAAKDLADRITESIRWDDEPAAKGEILAAHGHAPEFWSAVLQTLGPSGVSRLVKSLNVKDHRIIPNEGVRLRDAFMQGIALAFDESGLPRSLRETFLNVTPWRDVFELIERAGTGGQLTGILAAHLVELGQAQADGRNPGKSSLDYGQAMRRMRDLLRGDHSARRAFAMHPRTFSRPVQHIVNGADDWVVPMVEREIRRLPSEDRLRFREELIIRIGGQRWVHRDFRLLLLHLIAEEETLALLALATHGQMASGQPRTDLDRSTARDFVEVVMADADEGIEVEAAFWDYAQGVIEREAREPGGRHLEVAAGAAASILALIDAIRSRNVASDDAQIHAAMAVRNAVAEFVFINGRQLETSSKEILADGGLTLGEFVRGERVNVGLPMIHLDAVFDRWAQGRTSKRLLQDLLLLAIEAHGRHNRLDSPRAAQQPGDAPLTWLDRASSDPAYRLVMTAIDAAS